MDLYTLLFQIQETLDIVLSAGLQLTAEIPKIGKYKMEWLGQRIDGEDLKSRSITDDGNETTTMEPMMMECKDTSEECRGRGGICRSIMKTDKAQNQMKKHSSEKFCGFNDSKEEETELCACVGRACEIKMDLFTLDFGNSRKLQNHNPLGSRSHI